MSCSCVEEGKPCLERQEMELALEEALDDQEGFDPAVIAAEENLCSHLEQVKNELLGERNRAEQRVNEATTDYGKMERRGALRRARERYDKASEEFQALSPWREGGHKAMALAEAYPPGRAQRMKPPPGSDSGTGA